MNRRHFFKTGAGVAVASSLPLTQCSIPKSNFSELDNVLNQPVLKSALFSDPVKIDSVELLRYEKNFIVRVRSTDGAEGHAVCNNAHMIYLYPILLHKVVPQFIGRDARNLDQIVDDVFLKNSTYKLQGLALWIPLASVEFAVLDMLGRIAAKPVGELIGRIQKKKIAVYRANDYRGKTAEESIEHIIKNVAESGAKATKFKIGGRMSSDADYPPDRTEKLVPLMRETFPDLEIYADSNGSYSVDKAIEVGRLLQEHGIAFYEEPTPFDWLEETKAVADSLDIPIAGGEQETSMHRFRWLIANDALQIVQPDMFYFGGMIRAMRVSLMAHAIGLQCTPHISGSGLGYIYMLHFVSCIPNAGPFHEFKGINRNIPLSCDSSSLKSEEGVVVVPSGPGFGIDIDPDFIEKHKPVVL
jgi:L-alanine-DL-glutamate epimerase-like enolase superfamily enzyme